MKFRELQESFHQWGLRDPLWAIATVPGKKGNLWDTEAFFQTGTLFIDEVMDVIDGLEIDLRRRSALDFGCGVGRLTQPLAEHFDHVVGVDIANSMIDLANSFNRKENRCRYVLNQLADLSYFDNEMFDFVFSHITLQHMEPRYATVYVREFARVLAPGGLTLFQIPTERISIDPMMRRHADNDNTNRLEPGDPPMEMHGVLRQEVEHTLTTNGLVLLDVSENRSAGPGWVSHRFCAYRPRCAGSA